MEPQSSTWELRSSLHYSRWLWLEFTTFSAAEAQPNTSWLHFPARRTPPYNAEQHSHILQLHSDLISTFIFSSKAQEPQQDRTAARPWSRHPVPTKGKADKAGWCGDGDPTGQGSLCTAGPSSQTTEEHPNPALEEAKKLIHCSGGFSSTMLT